MAVGAYTGALLQIPPETKDVLLPDLPGFLAGAHLSAIPATIAAGLVTAGFALALAGPLMRLSGLTASLGTFVVLLIVNVVAKNWQEVTHGTAGISAVPTTTTRTSALIWALIALLAAYLFQQSASGLRLRASREDEIAARASGVRVTRERSVAWVLSAFFTGVAGALYASFLGSFNADFFFLGLTSLIVIMLVVGGSTSLAGAVVGTIVISVLAEAMRRAETEVDVLGLKEIGFAVAMLAILIVRPAGLTGGRELALPRARRFGPARRGG